ncbi:MAG TPA: hypothetical protein VHP63_07020, partial [candidate division Zixibacteria bacterium]|nr:hypothetical protein [candidate division Zixibacteria bacterium]
MKIVAELVKWGESLELWQSDALRRIWSQGELTSEDIEEIYLGLKESRGINIEKKLGLQPLTASHIASGSVHKQVTVIKSLHSLENVNAIVPNQQLTFATKGVTLVYGENASGKSGYSRVLKRACRARGSLEPIYHNIFDANAQQLTAKANIDVQIDGTSERILEWSSNSTPPECLSNIGVFDSKSARVYVDEENAVWYVPYGLDALTKLAELSQVLKTRLNTEITGLNVEPPIVSQVVGLGKLFSNLDHEVSKEFILKQTEFGETEEKLLASLKKKHADLVANDPKIKAKKLRALRQRIINLVDQLSLVIDSISDESIASLVKIHKDSEDAKVAAEIVAKKTFETEPLSGIGSESWRQLFESAKRFSEQEAYVEKPFPVTGTEAYCVLCQQPLAEEASNRLSRFWEFIKNDSASNAEKKRKQFDEQLKLALKSEPFISSVDELLLEELEDLSPGIKKSILDTKTSLSNRITLVKLAVRQSYWAGMPSITSFPAETLKKIADSCERGALESEKNSRPGELETCEKNILLYNQKKIASQQ